MKKAFIFTLDALFAITIFAIFLTAFAVELNVPQETFWLPIMAHSMMTTLDEQQVFFHTFRQDDVQIQSALNSYLDALPDHLGSKITIRIYTYTNDRFSPFRTVESSRGIIGDGDKTYAKRVFIDVNEKRFGIAELVLSYG